MSGSSLRYEAPGPFRAEDLRPGSRYELHDGHPVYCAPTGGDGARGNVAGAEVLDTDPIVKEVGIDPGYAPSPGVLRAPDVAVGNVPDQRGWIQGAPPLAVEYAGSGQDEGELRDKIADFLAAGTRLVWVVRLLGPRRVEVHEPGKPMRTLGPGESLSAPGLLQNSYPVEAFYDRATAHRLTLRNLLQREGYESLAEVREEGLKEGRNEGLKEGLREARAGFLLMTLEARGISPSEAERARILGCPDPARLEEWLRRALSANRIGDVLDGS